LQSTLSELERRLGDMNLSKVNKNESRDGFLFDMHESESDEEESSFDHAL
jgi:hypothetical protein